MPGRIALVGFTLLAVLLAVMSLKAVVLAVLFIGIMARFIPRYGRHIHRHRTIH